MKIVREYLEFEKMDFERGKEPYSELGVGKKQAIEQWLRSMYIEEYRINSDLSIDILKDVNLVDLDLKELPSYIKFRKIYGGFYAGGNDWESLNGFPDEVEGDLQLRSPAYPKGYLNSKIFNEDEIRKLIKVYGKIYH